MLARQGRKVRECASWPFPQQESTVDLRLAVTARRRLTLDNLLPD